MSSFSSEPEEERSSSSDTSSSEESAGLSSSFVKKFEALQTKGGGGDFADALSATPQSTAPPSVAAPKSRVPLKRKSHEAPRKSSGQRTFYTMDVNADGNMEIKNDGMHVTASSGRQAAVKLFNKRMRDPKMRLRLKDMFSKTEKAKHEYDPFTMPIPSEVEVALQDLRNNKVPQVVREGRKLVAEFGPKTKKQGSGMYVKLMKLGERSLEGEYDEEEDVKTAQKALDVAVHTFKRMYWTALKGEEDDRFYIGPFLVIHTSDGGDRTDTYMCRYVRKLKPNLLDVLKCIIIQARTVVVRGDMKTKLTGGMFKGVESTDKRLHKVLRSFKSSPATTHTHTIS